MSNELNAQRMYVLSTNARNIDDLCRVTERAFSNQRLSYVEPRFDLILNLDSKQIEGYFGKFNSDLRRIFATYMPKSEGGEKFDGNPLNQSKILEFLRTFASSSIGLLSVYWSLPMSQRQDICDIAKSNNVGIVNCYHDQKGNDTSEHLRQMFDLLVSREGNPKIAALAKTEERVKLIESFYDKLEEFNNKTNYKKQGIFIAMGELGVRTRTHPDAFVEFIALDKENRTAAGQRTLKEI